MFLDEAKIEVFGGAGGRGCVGWRREKYVAKGGPDGGDGGKGGDIVIIADENTDTLSDFSSRKKFEAEIGRYGSGNNRRGKDGEDLFLKVPPGTSITVMQEGKDAYVLADLDEHGDRVIAARGGRGGYGNAHFVNSVRQKPDFAELGEPGEERKLKLELKLVADVGIIGYPSVGKSTLISVISNARTKIGNYPFTTLIPNPGVAQVHAPASVVCDVPGLIEGASEGKGLGDKFLKHIERCGVLLHVLDLSRALLEENKIDADALIKDYQAIRKELEAYSPLLSKKRELVILNKIDLVASETKDIVKALKKAKIDIFMGISAATRTNTDDLIAKLLPIVMEERLKREEVKDDDEEKKALPVLKLQEESDKMGAYRVTYAEGRIQVKGRRLEQFTKMTNFDLAGALQRFQHVTEKIGLPKAVRHARQSEDDSVYIGDVDVTAYI